MIKKELLDIWKSAKSRLIAVAFLLIVGVDFAEKVYWQYQDFWELVLCQEKVQIKHAFFKVGLPCQSFCFFV